MQLQAIHLGVPDEKEAFDYRWSLFMAAISRLSGRTENDNKSRFDPETVSILNLPSLKVGRMKSMAPSEKIDFILSDKLRLESWIKKYKMDFTKSSKDSEKLATFHEAATRLKLLLDDSDFDKGELRTERRKALKEINDLFNEL
ncbi:hypothetical protein Bhyg_08503 [Pseudolycoriella hygida]|uniref:BAG domain-containing protein n=1 Tax=Pseudolycoriella hygida TaxID=35572 RepID=A0A9Q0N5U6_9DIPT|nr:hypothetical protein Bhyg_07113 [Pseudolycoriella hygida]KAJ6643541.1 hypothetical protein Bhyg_08503 [Pseudolycoriella hygida]